MRKLSWGRAAAVALGVAFSAVAPQAASAATFTITSAEVQETPGYLIGQVNHAGLPNGGEWAKIGRNELRGTDANGASVTFETFCADLFSNLSSGVFTEASASVLPYSAAQMSAVTAFLVNANPLVVSADTSAAAQLGVWEILNETSTNYDLTAGAFSVSGSDTVQASALANGWLANVANGSWSAGTASLAVLDAQGASQSQVFALQGAGAPAISAVPEPGTWALTLAGFGMMGLSLRRRRPADADALA